MISEVTEAVIILTSNFYLIRYFEQNQNLGKPCSSNPKRLTGALTDIQSTLTLLIP